MRVCEDVSAIDIVEFGQRPARGSDDMRRFKMRRCGCFSELGTELSEGEVGAATFDEGEGCGIPECGGASIAEYYFVALRDLEKLSEARTDAADKVANRGLAV